VKNIYGTHAHARISGEWKQATPSPTLDELAGRVARLIPCRRDPEAFHIEKAEIAATLRRLARKGGTP
jgi:hypothetical protein